MNQAVILEALRTPIGKFMGALKSLTAVDLGALVVKALLDKTSIAAEQVEEIIMGNVVSAGLGQNPARQVGLRAGLSSRVAALTINKVCGSGLKAVGLAAHGIQLGEAELIIAKQRNGPVGEISLTFLKEFTRFEDRARNVTEPEEAF